jgi:N-acylneuraminate cytidylyltransferase
VSNIAIIPARGGSKRIPRKNIKDFLGKPIIAYTIEIALESRMFDEVMVSTEDPEIAEVAKKYGASVPFYRSVKNSDDFTGPGDVVYEVLQDYLKENREFEFGCCLFATAPLLNAKNLLNAYDMLQMSVYDSVIPVAKFSYPIWRSYKIDQDGRLEMNFLEYEKMRSQDIRDAYHDAGQFYWFKIGKFFSLANKNIFGLAKGAVILDDMEVQDIDNLDDWKMAELKFSYITKKYNDSH